MNTSIIRMVAHMALTKVSMSSLFHEATPAELAAGLRLAANHLDPPPCQIDAEVVSLPAFGGEFGDGK